MALAIPQQIIECNAIIYVTAALSKNQNKASSTKHQATIQLLPRQLCLCHGLHSYTLRGLSFRFNSVLDLLKNGFQSRLVIVPATCSFETFHVSVKMERHHNLGLHWVILVGKSTRDVNECVNSQDNKSICSVHNNVGSRIKPRVHQRTPCL